ncbi:acetyltransferase [Ensifer sp. LC163]|uniref:acetyltransferase n=1 Tax=Ensifer sp. LC163 TaxID=1120652 RepID=UPI0039B779BB
MRMRSEMALLSPIAVCACDTRQKACLRQWFTKANGHFIVISQMTISIRCSRPADFPRTLDIWRSAVVATHDFLSSEDFAAIEQMVATQYLPQAALWIAVDAADVALGFMGMSEARIDALFVHAEARGGGVGRVLVEHAATLHPVLTVDVNEQNRSGAGFYARLGFETTGRSPVDDDGRPYPLLHLRRA